MTGFAREESRGELGTLSWELRSVNHRYLEPHFRLPEEFRQLEPELRERVSARLGRGKLECQLRFQPAAGGGAIVLDETLVDRLADVAERAGGALADPAPVNPFDILRWPGVVQEPEQDPEAVREEARRVFASALDQLVRTREAEGERIRSLLEERLGSISELVRAVRDRLPEVREAMRERLRQRLVEVAQEADAGRLEQEMAIVVQKMDVDEELDRLDAHVDEVSAALTRDEPVGRRLDFLMQELNREANTLASKAQDVATSRDAVDLKVLIEQMREQVQNVE